MARPRATSPLPGAPFGFIDVRIPRFSKSQVSPCEPMLYATTLMTFVFKHLWHRLFFRLAMAPPLEFLITETFVLKTTARLLLTGSPTIAGSPASSTHLSTTRRDLRNVSEAVQFAEPGADLVPTGQKFGSPTCSRKSAPYFVGGSQAKVSIRFAFWRRVTLRTRADWQRRAGVYVGTTKKAS